MKIQLTIDGTDRTRLVAPGTLRISNILTQQIDTASFSIRKFGDRTFAPSVGQEVVIIRQPTTGFPYTFPFVLDGATTRIFGGRIVSVEEEYAELDYVNYKIDCVDYTRDLDKRLVVEQYENMTIDAIIADIRTNYWSSDITINNVDANITVKYIAFNYEYPSQCLKQLAQLVNYDWYIDYNKDVHFFAKETNAAPFSLTDTNGKYVYDSLRIRRDITPVRNTIYVRGGEYLGDTITVEALGNGTKNIFETQYKMANLQLTVSGQIKNVGIDNVDNESLYDAMHNFQEKIIKFRGDKIPNNAKNVKIIGNPYLPVLVKVRDNTSIANFSATDGNDGIYEFKIVDKSIKTKEGARQRARAELLAYAATLSEGEFETYTDGLSAGQKITIQSTLRGISEDFIINRVEIRDLVPHKPGTVSGKIKYNVSLITTRTFDQIDLLQKLLTDKDKEIVISDDEVLDEIENGDETIEVAEAVTTTTEARNYQWGSGGTPQAYWNLFNWG